MSPFKRYNIYLEEVPTSSARKKLFDALHIIGVHTNFYEQKPPDAICTINCSPDFLGKVVSICVAQFGFCMVEDDNKHRYGRKR